MDKEDQSGHRGSLWLFPVPGDEYRRKGVRGAPDADRICSYCNSRMISIIVIERYV